MQEVRVADTVFENETGTLLELVRRDRVVDVPKPKTRPPLFIAGRVLTLRERKRLLAKKMQHR
jgi:hypothetical protein